MTVLYGDPSDPSEYSTSFSGFGSHASCGAANASLLAPSHSLHLFMTMLDESNTPSPAWPLFPALAASPATVLVLPQLKSSNFQYAYVGKTKFQIGNAIR